MNLDSTIWCSELKEKILQWRAKGNSDTEIVNKLLETCQRAEDED